MELKIGNKIKTLRKKQGITQEQLSDKIGVSFQAVSKWENNIALPDITLIPVIANYFGVSTDELLCYDSTEKHNEIKRFVDKAYEFRETDPEKGKKILEEGLKKYPGNDILLNNLLYVINYTKNLDETISIATKLIDTTNNSEVKYDALRFLAYAHSAKKIQKVRLQLWNRFQRFILLSYLKWRLFLTVNPNMNRLKNRNGYHLKRYFR